MKKFICTFLTVAFLAVVCSCTGSNSYAPSGYYKDDGFKKFSLKSLLKLLNPNSLATK